MVDYKGVLSGFSDFLISFRGRGVAAGKLVGMTQIYAHRGFHAVERENTVGAFLAAKRAGVAGVELDVRRTLDGELVVHHDPLIGELVIAQSTRADLPHYVPTLAEALEAARGVRVNVEIKNIEHESEPTYDASGEFARQVVTFLHDGAWAQSVIISCFDLATCAVVRSFDEEIAVGWLLWGVELSGALIQAHVLGLNAVHPHFSSVTDEAVREARELQLDVNVWTVNNHLDIKAMCELGVASIITDDPVAALSIARAQGPDDGHSAMP